MMKKILGALLITIFASVHAEEVTEKSIPKVEKYKIEMMLYKNKKLINNVDMNVIQGESSSFEKMRNVNYISSQTIVEVDNNSLAQLNSTEEQEQDENEADEGLDDDVAINTVEPIKLAEEKTSMHEKNQYVTIETATVAEGIKFHAEIIDSNKQNVKMKYSLSIKELSLNSLGFPSVYELSSYDNKDIALNKKVVLIKSVAKDKQFYSVSLKITKI